MEIGSVLLAAGRGTRLRPLTDVMAKPVLPVLDVPLAAWGLGALCTEMPPVVVNVSHLASGALAALDELDIEDWEAVSEEPEPFGTAGTLASLRGRVGTRVVTWNGDVVTALRPRDLLAAHTAAGAPATVAVRPVDHHADLEVHDGRISRFVDRRRENLEGGQFLGAAVFERAALELLPVEIPAGLGETLLRTLAGRGELSAYITNGYWIDVGTPERYLEVSLDVLYGRAPSPPVPLPGEIVDVDGGRAYLGPAATASTDSLGPGAIVLAGATVPPSARIESSIVWPGAIVEPEARLVQRVFTPF